MCCIYSKNALTAKKKVFKEVHSSCDQTEPLLLYIRESGLLTERLTLLCVHRAVSAVLGRGDSLWVSEVELRDELLLESSLLVFFKLEDS